MPLQLEGVGVGALAAAFCVLLILEPDMGTAIALMVMLIGMIVVAGTPPTTPGATNTIRVHRIGDVVRNDS